ncbi:hypothetical protein J0X19_23950 [Hymenobacter sp. BT186]|uniref:Uncharacterized protein n=1 Tax=Hymenobacter telluris TaxID=2816474 RepID=A0A939F028_9BACT|nr:hypothetical protein [Hymenobacter telluris]MBO0361034.1 hypothetical protein [Hymenobacter telluris]MBW3377062.1 hypothetical protein [Hymenobacter norwichensis]
MESKTTSSSYSDILSSLAILRVQNGNGQDYLQNFVPFLAECIRKCSNDTVTLAEIRGLFMSTFGLNVPQGVVRVLLERGVAAGYLKKTNKVYQRLNGSVANLTIEHDRAEAKRKLDALLQKFADFVQSELKHSISTEKGEQILYDFIREYGSDTLVPSRHSHSAEDSDSYLAGEFIKYLDAKDPVGFDYLLSAVQGSMMSSMLHYEDQSKIKLPWQNTSIYLDTPFILRTLELYGSVIQAPYIELVRTLIAEGVNIKCFSRTLEEIQGVLNSIKTRLQSGQKILQSFEELGEELLATSYKPVDIQLLSASLEDRLNKLGIEVEDEPPHLPHLVLDQLKAEEVFQSKLNYKRESAKEHDVAAVLSIHRLRLGRHPQQIERCVALFVTTNSRVVQAADQVMREQTYRASGEVSWCMQHDALVTRLFLKNPVTLTSLPRKQIIADAMAALKPTPDLWQLYLAEISALRAKGDIREEDITYLRCDPEALSALTKLTLNDSETYAEGTVEQVLRDSRAAIMS